MSEANTVKRAYAKNTYGPQQLQELAQCAGDPIYFMRHFVKVQHPLKGAVPFILHDFQKDMVNAFDTHRFNISMASRQLGKCVTFNINVLADDAHIEIGSLVPLRGLKRRLITWLERQLLKLVGE